MAQPAPPPPRQIRSPQGSTASSLRARAKTCDCAETVRYCLCNEKPLRSVVERQAADHAILQEQLNAATRFYVPDDGEPDPATPGTITPGAAPCGRPEPCDTGDCASCRAAGGRGHPEYLALTDELKKLHLLKSGGYGTGKDPFANFTNVAQASGEPRYLYPILRSLEKLTRCLSLHSQGRADELEEEFKDVASLLLCAAAMRREDTAA